MSSAPTAPAPPGNPTRYDEELLVFLNYRTTFEADSIDSVNLESWKEVLDAFGYTHLGRIQFLRELALSTSAEVMQSLCPYTTKAEWEPLLNKRAVRMENELANLCPPEMLPLQGLKNFLISCAKSYTRLTTVFLSPFTETNTRILLDRSEFRPFVDVVHCYTQREYAMLEVLEKLNIQPPTIPSALSHRWEQPNESPLTHRCRFVAFECDPKGVHVALSYGMSVVGVSYNGFEDGNPDKDDSHHKGLQDADDGGTAVGTKGDTCLLEAGASSVLRDYQSVVGEYLPQMTASYQTPHA